MDWIHAFDDILVEKAMRRREFIELCVVGLLGGCKDKGFVCQRSGLCCQKLVRPQMWVGGNLTWEQKQNLLKERKRYPVNPEGCEMLYFEGKKAVCLIHKLYGFDVKPRQCREYPGDKLCLMQTKKMNLET